MKVCISVFIMIMPLVMFGQNAVEHLSVNAIREHPGIPTSPVIHTVTHYFVVKEKKMKVIALSRGRNEPPIVSMSFVKGDTFSLQFKNVMYNTPPASAGSASTLPCAVEISPGIQSIVFTSGNSNTTGAHDYFPVYEIKGKRFEFQLPAVAEDDIKRIYYPSAKKSPVVITENAAGLLVPDFKRHKNLPTQNMAILPPQGLTVYDSPGGVPVGKLSRFCPVGKFTDGNMRMFILPDKNNNDCRHITLSHLHHWSDDLYMIPFFKNENGYVLLFNDSTLGGTWAKIDDIVKQDFKLLSWKDYFIEKRSIPAFAKDHALNLRESPYADAEKIITIHGDAMEIWITGYDEGFCEGFWCKVKVKVYKENPCTTTLTDEENLTGMYEGWVKLISDDGSPNVYMNTKGC